MTSAVLPSQRYKPASEKESAEQLKRVRNGVAIQNGYALDFTRVDPVLKITDAYRKELDAANDQAEADQKQGEAERAEFADILAGISPGGFLPGEADQAVAATGSTTKAQQG